MKAANIIFEDHEFYTLLKIKGKLTWRRFVLKLADLPHDKIPFVNPQKYYARRLPR